MTATTVVTSSNGEKTQTANDPTMKDELISKDELSFRQYAETPSAEHLQLNSTYREQREQAFKEKVFRDVDAVVFTHGDADGLTSAALIKEVFRSVIVEPVMYEGPWTLRDAMSVERRSFSNPDHVFILDLNLEDDDMAINMLQNQYQSESVHWIDHHQWEDPEAVRQRGINLVVDEDECTASLLLDILGGDQRMPLGGIVKEDPFDDSIRELVSVTKDYDLWIREDPRSERLQTWSQIAEPEEYIGTVRDYGVDFPEDVEERIDAQLEEERRIREHVVDRSVTEYVSPGSSDGSLHVAFAYAGKGPTAQIGNDIVDDGADVAVVMKGSTGCGIYSESDERGFTRCHEVAQKLGGGGHKTAAGFGFEFDSFIQLCWYWATGGESRQSEVIRAIYDVIEDG